MIKKEQTLKRVDAPVYRYRQALYMAFYSRQLYVDVAKRWRGFCFLYLLLVIAIVSIPYSVHSILNFNHYMNDQIISPLEKIPPLHVQNGEVLFDKPMPYLIRNNSGDVIIMIDTNDKVSGMDANFPQLKMLIAKNKLYLHGPHLNYFLKTPDKVNTPPLVKILDKNMSGIFVAKDWIKDGGLLPLKWFLRIMVYPMIVSFFLCLSSTFFLVFTMLAQTVSWLIFRFKLSFMETTRMLVVASTAQMSAFLLLLSVNRLLPNMGLICVGLVAIYFSYAVLAVKRESKMMVHA